MPCPTRDISRSAARCTIRSAQTIRARQTTARGQHIASCGSANVIKRGAERLETESLVGANTAGLLFIPADYVAPDRGMLALWRRHLVANAAVRDRDYMVALFHSHFP